MDKFTNNPIVIKFATEQFDNCYKKENCPEWMIFDIFRKEAINRIIMQLDNHCNNYVYLDTFCWELRGLFDYNNYYAYNSKIIPKEIDELFSYKRYIQAKDYVNCYVHNTIPKNKIIYSYENNVKKELDSYLCDDLICIIVNLIYSK